MNLLDATAEEIENNYGLYYEMIKIMTSVTGKAPNGSCCGRNKLEHCKDFVANREKYIQRMEEIKNRKIKPKWNGVLYVSKAHRHYDAKTITDKESIKLIESGFLSDVNKYFEIPEDFINGENQKTEQKVEQPVEEAPVAPKKTTKKKTTKKK